MEELHSPRKCSVKTVLEWITTICSTLSVIGIAFLLQSSCSNPNEHHSIRNLREHNMNDKNENTKTISGSSSSSSTRVGMLNGATILVTGAGSG